ncbi:preprotein translocase subunit SecG [Buchnera aphidicola (Kurisakia onigurumii)]|uniref:preprotein translocase subunit SecG n=1 Tax=Buchnera aphidicola TaxID=9 RepID=UPI0031B6FD8F
MKNFLVFVLSVVSFFLILLIMIQPGKESNMNFSSSYNTTLKLFRFILIKNKFISILTIIFATLFFIINLLLCHFIIQNNGNNIIN